MSVWGEEGRLASLEKLVDAHNDKLIELMEKYSRVGIHSLSEPRPSSQELTISGFEAQMWRNFADSEPKECLIPKDIPLKTAVQAILDHLGLKIVQRNARETVTLERK